MLNFNFMIDSKTIEHLAELARIKITEKPRRSGRGPDIPSSGEKDTLVKDLSSILGYIEKLNEVDTNTVEPLYQTTGLVNSVRNDEDRNEFKMSEALNEKLIGQSPHKENRFIKVKSILNK